MQRCEETLPLIYIGDRISARRTRPPMGTIESLSSTLASVFNREHMLVGFTDGRYHSGAHLYEVVRLEKHAEHHAKLATGELAFISDTVIAHNRRGAVIRIETIGKVIHYTVADEAVGIEQRDLHAQYQPIVAEKTAELVADEARFTRFLNTITEKTGVTVEDSIDLRALYADIIGRGAHAAVYGSQEFLTRTAALKERAEFIVPARNADLVEKFAPNLLFQ